MCHTMGVLEIPVRLLYVFGFISYPLKCKSPATISTVVSTSFTPGPTNKISSM